MPEGAIIYDRAYFDSAEWRNQANDHGGFGRGAAWLDLLALVNQKPTTFACRGIQKAVERGQCAYSKLALSERWGWSQSKVAACLAGWEKTGRVQIETGNDGTLISVLNYDAYQVGLLALIVEQNASRPRTNREQTETEKREEIGSTGNQGEKREGEEEGGGHLPEQVSDEVMLAFGQTFAGEPASGSPPMPSDWVTEFIKRLNGRREFPRDWRRLMVASWRAEFREWTAKAKKTAPAKTAVSASVSAIQMEKELRELEEQVHEDRLANLPRDPKKLEKLKKLRAAFAELKGQNG